MPELRACSAEGCLGACPVGPGTQHCLHKNAASMTGWLSETAKYLPRISIFTLLSTALFTEQTTWLWRGPAFKKMEDRMRFPTWRNLDQCMSNLRALSTVLQTKQVPAFPLADNRQVGGKWRLNPPVLDAHGVCSLHERTQLGDQWETACRSTPVVLLHKPNMSIKECCSKQY